MISDYSRVAELSAAAYDSAGAGQVQYEKTLDSLQSKQEKLKNSWNEFLMGIANQEAIKTVVDLLNGLLGTLNKIISFLSGNSGLLKTALSLLTVAGGFKLGKSILGQTGVANSGIWSALFGRKNDAVKQGQETGKGFVSGFKQATSKKDFLKDYFSWKKEYSVDLSKNLDKDFINKNYHFDFSSATVEQLEEQKKAIIGVLSQGNAEMQNLGTSFSSLWDAGKYDEAQEALKKYNIYLKMTGEEAQKTGVQVKQASANFQMMAQSTAMAATSLMALGGLFDNLGLDDLGVIFTSLGTAMMGLIPIITMVQTAMINGAQSVSQAIWNIPIIGWISAIVSALIALIQIIAHFAKKYKAETPEEKLERMQEATEEAKKSAEEAKDAYDELLSVKTDYQEKIDALDKLVQGTDEWKRALIEANQAAIDLMQSYPELASGGFVKQLENGLLSIDNGFWDEQINKQYEQVQMANARFFSAQSAQTSKQITAKKEGLRSDLNKVNFYGRKGNLDEQKDELIDKLIEIVSSPDYDANMWKETKISAEELDSSPQIIRDTIIRKYGQLEADEYTYDGSERAAEALGDFSHAMEGIAQSMPELTSKLFELKNALDALEMQQTAQNKLAIESLLSDRTRTNGEVFTEIISENLTGVAFDNTLALEQEKISIDAKNTWENQERFKELVEQYGITSQMTGDALHDAKVLYKEMYGQEVPESYIDDKDWILDQIALASVYEESAQSVERLANALQKFDSQTQKNITELLKGGKGFSFSQLEELTSERQREYLASLAQEGDYDLSNAEGQNEFAKALGYDSWENLLSGVQAEVENTKNEWENARSYFDDANGQTDMSSKFSNDIINSGVDLETYKNLTETFTNIGIKDMTGRAKILFGQVVSQIFNDLNLSEGVKENFKNLLSAYDLSDYDEVEKFLLELENTGTATEEEIKTLKTALLDLGQAFKKVDLSKLATQIKNTLDLADEIEGRAKSEGLSQKELDILVNSGIVKSSDFYFTGQEFIPIEGSMNSLADAIRANTDAIIQNTLSQLQKQIREGQWFSDAIDRVEAGISDSSDIESLNRIRSGENVPIADAEMIRKLMGDGTASDAEALAWYNANVDSYLRLSDNISQMASYGENMIQASAYQMGPQKLLEQIQSGAFVTNMNEKVAGYGVNFTQKDAEQLLDDQIAINNLGDNVSNLTEAYRENGGEIADNSALMKAHALQLDKVNKKAKTLCETVEDNKDAFITENKAVLAGANGSEEYRNALEKIVESGQDVFGKGFDDKFVQENSKLVAQLAKGGKVGAAAFDQIQQKISSETLEQLQNFNQQLLNSEELMAELNGVESEFKVNGTADVTQLMQMLMNAGYTADEVAEKIEALTGATITYDVEYQYVNLPIGSKIDAQGQVEIGQGKKNGKLGFEKVAIPHVIKAVGSKNNYPSSFSGGSSGGGGGGSEKLWENPYDELYNLTEKINEALRQREKLEREYDRILERRGSTYQELRANYDSQLASLEKEIEYQKELQAGRKRQLDKLSSETYADEEGNQKSFADWGATNYASYDQVAGVIRIDWSGIDKITDTEKGGAIEAYISRLEELQDQFEETQETIEDMQDTVEELKKDQMDEYLEFEQKVYDAIVNREQKVIDDFQSISDKLAEENNKILDSLQESIDLERQIRDNTKTEEDINEKEARLAYLRRDTSNANLLEIKQLEEELTDSRQSYSDTLVDQKISELQNQNEKAQEVREKQIELMQAQLDHNESEGAFWEETMGLIESALINGKFQEGSALAELLKNDEGFQGLSKFGQLDWSEEIAQGFLAAMHGYTNWKQYEAENITYSAKLANGTNLSYNPETKKWTDSSGAEYSDVQYNAESGTWGSSSIDAHIDYAKKIISAFNSGNVDEVRALERQRDAKIDATSSPYGKTKGKVADALAAGLTAPLDTENSDYKKNYDEAWASGNYFDAIKFEALRNRKLSALGKSAQNEILEALFKKEGKVFKTGGLADFTGPAWLDGTRSKPELILNARDTENLIQLKDVLGSFMRGSAAVKEQKNGDNYFDIDINVEEISDDYDVDRLAERVKEQMYKDSTYRNINSIRLLR